MVRFVRIVNLSGTLLSEIPKLKIRNSRCDLFNLRTISAIKNYYSFIKNFRIQIFPTLHSVFCLKSFNSFTCWHSPFHCRIISYSMVKFSSRKVFRWCRTVLNSFNWNIWKLLDVQKLLCHSGFKYLWWSCPTGLQSLT